MIVEDNVVSFPALPACGRPWVRIVSCNPAEIKDPDVPPTFSGYPAADRPAGTSTATSTGARTRTCTRRSTRSAATAARPALPDLEFMHTSPYLNLYLYPDEVDYARARAARRHLAQPAGERPRRPTRRGSRRDGDGPLVYLSLGSLGSGDVELMRTLIGTLADAPYRVVVSKGPQHDQLELRRT